MRTAHPPSAACAHPSAVRHPTPPQGTLGLLLHSPSNATVASLLARQNDPSLRAFADNQLWLGGNVLTRPSVRVLSSRCDTPGGREVIPGLYEARLQQHHV